MKKKKKKKKPFSPGCYYQPELKGVARGGATSVPECSPHLVPVRRAGTKGGTFSPDPLVPARYLRLQVVFDQDKRPVTSRVQNFGDISPKFRKFR